MKKAIFLCAILATTSCRAFWTQFSPPAHAPCVKEDYKIASPMTACMHVYQAKATDLYVVATATVEPVQNTKHSEMYIAIRQRSNRHLSLNSYLQSTTIRNTDRIKHLHIDPGLNRC